MDELVAVVSPAEDVDGRTVGELFSGTVIWYSWFKDGESRPLAIAGMLRECGSAGIGPPEGVYYRFSYNDGSGWVGFVPADRGSARRDTATLILKRLLKFSCMMTKKRWLARSKIAFGSASPLPLLPTLDQKFAKQTGPQITAPDLLK